MPTSAPVGEKIHRALAEKTRNRNRARGIVNALWLANVFEAPVNQHGKQIAYAHCVDVIVSDVEDRAGKRWRTPRFRRGRCAAAKDRDALAARRGAAATAPTRARGQSTPAVARHRRAGADAGRAAPQRARRPRFRQRVRRPARRCCEARSEDSHAPSCCRRAHRLERRARRGAPAAADRRSTHHLNARRRCARAASPRSRVTASSCRLPMGRRSPASCLGQPRARRDRGRAARCRG